MAQKRLRLVFTGVGVFSVLGLLWPAESRAQTASARATNVRSDRIVVNDTGEVTNGSEEKAIANVNLMGLGSAKVLNALAKASIKPLVGGTAASEAAAKTLSLNIPVPHMGTTIPISADVLKASATATCTTRGRPPVLDGEFYVTNLAINGLAVATNPNTVISPAPGVTIAVNEEIKSTSGRTGTITINGLRITLADADPNTGGAQPTEIVVNSARARATCAL
jgi:hypothetical protein